MSLMKRSALLLAAPLLAACASEAARTPPDPTVESPTPTPAPSQTNTDRFNLHVAISDLSEEVPLLGGFSILPAADESPQLTLSFVGWGRPVALDLSLSPDQTRALTSGQTLRVPDRIVGYHIGVGMVYRTLESIRMVRHDDHTQELFVAMGPVVLRDRYDAPLPPTAHARVHGAVSVSCATALFVLPHGGGLSPRADPTFATPFCQRAVQSVGLEPLREQGVPDTTPEPVTF